NRWCGGEQNRERKFTFGLHIRIPDCHLTRFHVVTPALEPVDYRPAVISSGQAGKGGPRASIAQMALDQGIDPRRFDNSPFTMTELRRAIANGVPLPMGIAVAMAVKRSLEMRKIAA